MAKPKSVENLQEDLKKAKEELKQYRKDLRIAMMMKKRLEKLAAKPPKTARQTKNSAKSKTKKPTNAAIKKANEEVNKKQSQLTFCIANIKRIEGTIQKKKTNENRKHQGAPINYELFTRPSKCGLQPEIFYDIIKFLPRQEIEYTCQFVSRWWNRLILNGTRILPLRNLYSLTYDVSRYRTSDGNGTIIRSLWRYRQSSSCYGTILKNSQRNLGLTNCVWTKFVAYADEMDEKFFKKLQEMEKKYGINQFFAKEIVVTISNENLEDTEKDFEKMRKFLENNITFGELTLKLGTETLAHIMENPKFLVSLQHFPVIMLINSYQRRDYTIEELLKFIENNPVPENQLSLELSGNNCRDDFGSRLIDTFMTHKNPSRMIRQVTAESWNFHVLKIITISNLTGMATTNNATVLKDNEGMEYYELKRKDGWILRVNPHKRCREPTYLRCLEFKIYKK